MSPNAPRLIFNGNATAGAVPDVASNELNALRQALGKRDGVTLCGEA